MDITFDRRTLQTALLQRFTLPTYQRDYRWESKHLQELLTDIQEQFLSNYESSHGRAEVAVYSPYFLGTIITTNGAAGKRSIIDGQQRLTTITVILTYLYRWSLENSGQYVANVEQLIRRTMYGDSEFNLEFDRDRFSLFKLLMDHPNLTGEELDKKVESIDGISPGTQQAYVLYNLVESFIADEIKDGLMSRFVDYLIDKVYLFEIGVPSEQDGHKVFVTMNDRGLRLAPLDLLKGFLLSNISDHEANASANKKWAECVRELRSLGRDEDVAFFKTWLRAQYAESTRGKSRGDAPADFELIGDGYHRWVVENANIIGLATSDDYYDLVERKIPFYVRQYIRIRKAESVYNADLAHVYYNGVRGLTLQAMLILSALDVNDTSAVIDKKIRLVSYYLDSITMARLLERKDNAYNNIKDIVFAMANRIRRGDLADIVQTLDKPFDEIEKTLSQIAAAHYYVFKRQDVLHILARMGDYLENALDLTNRVGFAGYVVRDQGAKTFDVEHIMPAPSDVLLGHEYDGAAVYTTDDDYTFRHLLGGLILLPRGRNRSMQDMNYPDKRLRYSTENVLAQTLTDEFYQNHPNVSKFITETGFPLQAESLFDGEAIVRRGKLYVAIGKQLWSRRLLHQIAE